MISNRKELKKISAKFNSVSNRLLKSDFRDYMGNLKKFVSFLKDTPIIYDFIKDCGQCRLDLSQMIPKVAKSYGRETLLIGEADNEEVRDIFAILDYIVENDVPVANGIGMSYAHSTKFQDHVNAFNDRVVMILINHIENYLTEIGIDMGIDETKSYIITVQNGQGQVIIAPDTDTLNATNTVGINEERLNELINAIKDNANNLSIDESDALDTSLKVVQDEVISSTPKKNVLKTAISAIKGIKGSTEFAAAMAALIQFLEIEVFPKI